MMRIESVTIENFKNFTKPVVITGWDSFVTIHGPNSVGKTNLLEAIGIIFSLIGSSSDIFSIPLNKSADELARLGYGDATEWFNRIDSAPISLEMVISVAPGESRDFPKGVVVGVSLRIQRIQSVRCEVVDFTMREIRGSKVESAELLSQIQQQMVSLFWQTICMRNGVPQFRIINTRQLDEPESNTRTRLPQKLLLKLYEASISEETTEQRRWGAFQNVAVAFPDLFQSCEFAAVYQPRQQKAALQLYDRKNHIRIPIHLLGFGVQQLVGLIAEVIFSGASIVVLEEPEASLAYGMHARLRDILKKILEDGLGPGQIILTSHSPLFDQKGRVFLSLYKDNGHVQARWLPGEKALEVTGHDLEGAINHPVRAPRAYVTTEGAVLLPEFVRTHLGVDNGGGVVFWKKEPGHIEMVNDDEALRILGDEQ